MSALGVTVRPTGNVRPRWFWFLRSPQPHNTPDRKRAPEASVSTAAVAGLQGPPGGCAHRVPSPGAGANDPPWYPNGRAERRQLPLPPPAGPGSREESRVSHRSPRLGGSHAAQTYPEHRHILDSQLVTHTDVLPTVRGALQMQQQPSHAIHSDVGDHSERVPTGEGRALASGTQQAFILSTHRTPSPKVSSRRLQQPRPQPTLSVSPTPSPDTGTSTTEQRGPVTTWSAGVPLKGGCPWRARHNQVILGYTPDHSPVCQPQRRPRCPGSYSYILGWHSGAHLLT